MVRWPSQCAADALADFCVPSLLVHDEEETNDGAVRDDHPVLVVLINARDVLVSELSCSHAYSMTVMENKWRNNSRFNMNITIVMAPAPT